MNVCAECGGKCCLSHEGIYVTKNEYLLLPPEYRDILNVDEFMGGYRTKGKRCPFLNEKGCILPMEYKFIECKLFPLEAITIDKLIINEAARKKCQGLSEFVTPSYYKKSYELLKDYVSKGLLTKDDINGIINTEYDIL